ncbi:hypothetical protein I3F58_00605 [Streptomyces sp. MUM 203J]|uniref:hypothetical protein n=1 Tax=Streptomyces sp. MUM 203J TaxID=2791990 RepID=UPI001F04C420|nr:hypothetical protein [Streptomyces sp. MUM 203J]MCH0538084.1 hypothetical protein [Streptomyces sp. MUM 203J]
MRGDETQPTAADGEAARTRRGPRHAAPRKSLLTRLQGPAGKAIALAAMPTAVIVGMSLTPRPAMADENDIPFAPGPCVTQPDEQEQPEDSEEPKATPSPSASQDSQDSREEQASGKERKPEAEPQQQAPKPSSSPSPGRTEAAPTAPVTEPGAGTGADAGSPTGSTAPETAAPGPAPTETRNPLDPLGVGETVKDFFGGLLGTGGSGDAPAEGDGTATEQQAQTQPQTRTEEEPPPAEPPAAGRVTDKVPETVPEAPTAPTPQKTPEAVKDTAEDTAEVAVADTTEEAIRKAADQVGAEVEELPEDARGLDAKQDEDIPDGAKPRFPCPTSDPEALAAAELEPGMPQLPDEPWQLESTLLTLRGLDYHGIVEVQTGSGKVKKVLKFTASEVDIKDLHQKTVHSEGRTGHVTSRAGSTSTMRNGTVTMYTEELKGNLFGIIPVTFSPETPPPLDVPFAFFTNARVTQAGQFGGTLTVPGLRNFIEG